MYHQRLNGTERAAIDAITPAKGEYVRLCEKKHILHDSKPIPPRIQTAAQPRHRPSSETDSRIYVASGPYRDSKEIMDDDEVMSEKADDQVASPTDWQSGQTSPVVQEQTPKFPMQRSNKMNLDHMIWPTNDMETRYTPSSYYGGMVKDEDAARIEEEFKKATPPPPDSAEPNSKRKLQRLSSGTLDTVPAKRANTPGKKDDAEKSSQTGSNNKNILKPFFRKIASLASNRNDVAPVAPVEPEPAPPSLRSHPYLVRHKMSPATSSSNVDSEATSPMTPTSRTTPWQHGEYASPSPRHQRAPPPYSGQDLEFDHSRSGSYRASDSSSPHDRRQYRSREASLSALASEMTFEPTRSSLSPMHEEPNRAAESATTLAPFNFSSKPQGVRTVLQYPGQSYSTPPATPMDRADGSYSGASSSRGHAFPFDVSSSSSSSARTQTMASPLSEVADDDDTAMQCDEEPPVSSSAPGPAVSGPAMNIDATSSRGSQKMKAIQRMETEGMDVSGTPKSSNSRRTSAAVAPAHQPHPHYVASYYAPAPSPAVQLLPRNPQAISIMPAPSASSSSSSTKPPLAPVAPRPARQFAPIRPRTPITVEDESKGRAATEPASSSQKKKKGSSALESKQPQQPPLRPLVPTVFPGGAAAPPPYRPPLIAYPSPYTHLRAPDGSAIRPPTPMLMAVDYTHAGLAAAGHAPQFIAAAPPGDPGHPGAPRIFIPVIPVMYNKPPAAPATPLVSGKAPGKSTLAKIAPRLHRAS